MNSAQSERYYYVPTVSSNHQILVQEMCQKHLDCNESPGHGKLNFRHILSTFDK